ncbi:hypothetical protein SANT12839_099630 [Streptomyces antimycoticus]|uniref:Uncharacterized protein n=1 Tax=Streptomyces antimycoticus TaxID=68175 RepID=A0A4D4KIT4_9ACTN|nr:hypothetical protein SANT12839_099630 [Streptomyces antimycoticus]
MEVGVETAQAVSAAVGKLPRMDELTRRRVYGADHEDPRTAAGKRLPGAGGRAAGRTTTARDPVDRRTAERRSISLITEIGAHEAGGRALYGLRADDPKRWEWEGDMP